MISDKWLIKENILKDSTNKFRMTQNFYQN
jgi:hypothetical protein